MLGIRLFRATPSTRGRQLLQSSTMSLLAVIGCRLLSMVNRTSPLIPTVPIERFLLGTMSGR